MIPNLQKMCYDLAMITRTITPKLTSAAQQFGVVSLTGPRQSGKTTLVRSVFPHHEYVNLENLAQAKRIKDDPLGFIQSITQGVIVDEIQKFPDLLSYIQVSIDEDFQPGKFIITGSQNLLLSEKITQSLAGRVAILTLLPLTISELQQANKLSPTYTQTILKGFYPGLYDKDQEINLFYTSYLNTYVERDVRNIQAIGDLSSFERFLQLLAGRIGQLTNLSQLGNLVGVTHKTIETWLSILEASYVIIRLQPYYNNFGKRITKSPKIYFTDTGLACHLLGIDSEKELSSHFVIGGLFENAIIIDLFKTKLNTLSSTRLYFFRDHSGNEVDLILDCGSSLVPIEIKASSTYSQEFLKGISFFNKLHPDKNTPQLAATSYVLYAGQETITVHKTTLLPWQKAAYPLLHQLNDEL